MQELLAASVSKRDIDQYPLGQENGEAQVTATTILSAPRLRWTGAAPVFEIGLQPTPPAWMDGQRYILKILDQSVPILSTGAEWRMENAAGVLEVEPIHSALQADLKQGRVSALASPLSILLTPDPEPFGIYDLATGRRIDPLQRGHDFNRPTALLCKAGVTTYPSSPEFYRAFEDKWVFLAFRGGLPADLEIREGELAIWSPGWILREARPEPARSNRMAITSSGGWWGETVQVYVATVPGLQLLRVQAGSQRFDLTQKQPGHFQGSLALLAGVDYNCTAQIECINEGRLERRTGDLQFSEVNGVALETENGWKPFDNSRDIDIDYFQERRILARFPPDWQREKRKPEDWVFLEGDHFCQRPRPSVSSLRDSLHGVGEPLWLSVGPYNHPSPGERLTKGLLNSGIIRWVSQEADYWKLELRNCIELGDHHAIWVWQVGEAAPLQLSRSQWSHSENVCEVRSAFDGTPAGFAISSDGAWLGARTASPGLFGLQQIIEGTGCWATTARWLRWWRAPLLYESLKTQLRVAGRTNWTFDAG